MGEDADAAFAGSWADAVSDDEVGVGVMVIALTVPVIVIVIMGVVGILI